MADVSAKDGSQVSSQNCRDGGGSADVREGEADIRPSHDLGI